MIRLPVIWSARFLLAVAPRGKPRHRARVIRLPTGDSIAQMYEDPDGRRAELELATLAAPHAPPRPWAGPVEIDLEFRLPVTESWALWEREAALEGGLAPTSKPDVDNAAKLVLDALTRSGKPKDGDPDFAALPRWWADDAKVIALRARKVYGPAGEVLVVVRFLREPTREEWKAAESGQKQEVLFGGSP